MFFLVGEPETAKDIGMGIKMRVRDTSGEELWLGVGQTAPRIGESINWSQDIGPLIVRGIEHDMAARVVIVTVAGEE